MIEAGYNCRAIEQSTEMVDAARLTLQQRHVGDPNWVIQGQAQRLPFPNASFDNVVSTFPSEYIYDCNTISEAERVLRPNGRLIVIVGAHLLPVGLVHSFLLLTQVFVYGPALLLKYLKSDRWFGDRETSTTDITSEVVFDAEFGKHIPLEQYKLHRRCERVRSHNWEAYIVIGEKWTITCN